MPSPRRTRAGSVPGPIYAMAFVNACIGLGYGVVAPVVPVFAKDFGVSDFAASGVVSVYALTRVLASFGASRLLLRVDLRTVLVAGLVVAAASSFAAAFAPDFRSLLALRALGGIGTAMFSISGQQLLFRYTTPENGGRVASVFQSGFLVGGVLGPVVGGGVAVWSIRAPFLTHALTLVVGLAVVLAALRSRGSAAASGEVSLARPPEPLSFAQAWSNRGYRAAVANNFANGWIGNGLRFTLIPLFVTVVVGASPFVSGVLLFVGAAVQFVAVAPCGMLVDRWGRRPALATGGGIVLVGLVLLAALPTMPVLFAVMVLWGIGGTIAMVASTAAAGDVLHGRGGTPVAVFQVSFDAGTMLGPLVAGFVAGQVSYAVAFAVCIPIVSLAIALCLVPWKFSPSIPQEDRCLDTSHSDGSPTISSLIGRDRGPVTPVPDGQTVRLP